MMVRVGGFFLAAFGVDVCLCLDVCAGREWGAAGGRDGAVRPR